MRSKIPFLLVSLLFCCHPERRQTVTEDQLRFETTDASELFFQNVRKSDYLLEERRDAGMNLFRLEAMKNANLALSPVLVVNWKMDKAYFHLENNTEADHLIFLIKGHVTDTVIFDGSSQTTNALVAMEIYNALLEGREIYYLEGEVQRPFFEKSEDAESFRIQFFDFLRLVELR